MLYSILMNQLKKISSLVGRTKSQQFSVCMAWVGGHFPPVGGGRKLLLGLVWVEEVPMSAGPTQWAHSGRVAVASWLPPWQPQAAQLGVDPRPLPVPTGLCSCPVHVPSAGHLPGASPT